MYSIQTVPKLGTTKNIAIRNKAYGFLTTQGPKTIQAAKHVSPVTNAIHRKVRI